MLVLSADRRTALRTSDETLGMSEETGSAAIRRGAFARRPSGRLIARTVALELLEARREGVLAAGPRLHDVVEVADLCGAGGGLDRGEPGVADRSRGKPGVRTGVVGGVARELARRQRRRP